MKRRKRTYWSERQFVADRKKMWAEGWLVVAVDQFHEREVKLGDAGTSSLLAFALWPIFRWIDRRTPHDGIVVVYERAEEG